MAVVIPMACLAWMGGNSFFYSKNLGKQIGITVVNKFCVRLESSLSDSSHNSPSPRRRSVAALVS